MIREYIPSDKKKILNILKLNIPKYFVPAEEELLANYLDHKTEDYFVIEINGEVIGAGGINYFLEDRNSRLSWDLIHPYYQGLGLGKQLVEFRISLIKKNPSIKTIIVRTTQQAHIFYQKTGFELTEINKDYWAPGFDLYLMKQELKNHPH